MWDTPSDTFSSLFAIVIFSLVIIFPIFVWFLLWKKFWSLRTEKCIHRFGSLYAELRTDSRFAVLYNVLYLVRRLYFVLVCLELSYFPFLQVQALIFHSILLLIFDTLVRPFHSRLLNNLEIFNEVCILGASYHLLIFTEYDNNENTQYNGGFSIIAITTLNILVNMGIMMYMTFQKIKNHIRKFRFKFREWLHKRSLLKAKKSSYLDTKGGMANLSGIVP